MSAERRAEYYRALAETEHHAWAIAHGESAYAGWVRRRGETVGFPTLCGSHGRIRPPFMPPVLDRNGPRLVVRDQAHAGHTMTGAKMYADSAYCGPLYRISAWPRYTWLGVRDWVASDSPVIRELGLAVEQVSA